MVHLFERVQLSSLWSVDRGIGWARFVGVPFPVPCCGPFIHSVRDLCRSRGVGRTPALSHDKGVRVWVDGIPGVVLVLEFRQGLGRILATWAARGCFAWLLSSIYTPWPCDMTVL